MTLPDSQGVNIAMQPRLILLASNTYMLVDEWVAALRPLHSNASLNLRIQPQRACSSNEPMTGNAAARRVEEACAQCTGNSCVACFAVRAARRLKTACQKWPDAQILGVVSPVCRRRGLMPAAKTARMRT